MYPCMRCNPDKHVCMCFSCAVRGVPFGFGINVKGHGHMATKRYPHRRKGKTTWYFLVSLRFVFQKDLSKPEQEILLHIVNFEFTGGTARGTVLRARETMQQIYAGVDPSDWDKGFTQRTTKNKKLVLLRRGSVGRIVDYPVLVMDNAYDPLSCGGSHRTIAHHTLPIGWSRNWKTWEGSVVEPVLQLAMQGKDIGMLCIYMHARLLWSRRSMECLCGTV